MTPREQLRKMTAMGEQGTLDEKHWYRLVNGMSAGGETDKISLINILAEIAFSANMQRE